VRDGSDPDDTFYFEKRIHVLFYLQELLIYLNKNAQLDHNFRTYPAHCCCDAAWYKRKCAFVITTEILRSTSPKTVLPLRHTHRAESTWITQTVMTLKLSGRHVACLNHSSQNTLLFFIKSIEKRKKKKKKRIKSSPLLFVIT